MELAGEKPKYKLLFRIRSRRCWTDFEHCFNASDDNEAREAASSLIKRHNSEDKEAIKSGRKDLQDWNYYVPVKLERLSYVVKEVEERVLV